MQPPSCPPPQPRSQPPIQRLTLLQLLCSPDANRMLISYCNFLEEERAEEARHKQELEAIESRKRTAVQAFLKSAPHVDEAHVSATVSLYSDAVAINVDPPVVEKTEEDEEEDADWIEKYHAECDRREREAHEEEDVKLTMPLPDEVLETVAKQPRTERPRQVIYVDVDEEDEKKLPKSPPLVAATVLEVPSIIDMLRRPIPKP